MKFKIIFVTVVIGLILTISPYKTYMHSPAGKPSPDAGAMIYSDNNCLVFLAGNTITVKPPGAGRSSRVRLPGISGSLPDGRPNIENIEMAGDILKLTMDGSVYMLRLRPQTAFLTVYPDPGCACDKIIIDKNKNILYLFKKGSLKKVYRVATGEKPQYTPEGRFVIKNKYMLDPNYSEGRYGPRWLGIGVPGRYDLRSEKPDPRAPLGIKYGIHGTNEPESIGKYASAGCVRMLNHEVTEIYDQVEVGTPVEIIR